MEITDTQKAKLPCVVAIIVSVYVLMFTKVHLNPRAPERPSNMVFLRDLLPDFRDNDEMMVGGSLKKASIKHFCTSVNPITVCLNLCSKNPVYQLKHFQDPEQHLQRIWTPKSWSRREHLLSAISALKVKVHLAF